MIINISSTGNHTNQIYQFIQLDSFCKERKIKYCNLQLYKLFPFFPNLKNKYGTFTAKVFFPFFSFIILCLCKIKLFKFYFLTEKNDCIKLVESIKKNPKKNYFTKGWSHDNNYIFYVNEDLENKYRENYNFLFSTSIDSIKEKYFCSNCPVTIGLHIRRGDYKEYKNGIYYYNDETYISVVKQLLNLLNEKDVNVLVFTNDKSLNYDIYKNSFSNVFFSHENFQTDYTLLANCNYIIGAPSSFTMWSSYIGQVPLYHIKDKEKIISLSDFIISAGL